MPLKFRSFTLIKLTMKRPLTIVLLFFVFIVFCASVSAAPYNGAIFTFKQPNDSVVTVKLYGDEFYIRAESLDGYTLVRDEKTGWICYATLSVNGDSLLSTGIHYSTLKSTQANLVQHIDISAVARQQVVDRNRKLLYPITNDTIFNPSKKKAAADFTSDTIKGLCIAVDFSDQPSTVTIQQINDFCNGDNFTGFGNNGSLMQYFKDVSGGRLIYKNVVYGIFRAPKKFADYEKMGYTVGAKEILGIMLKKIDSLGFNFSKLSTNQGYIRAINLMYTGEALNWSQGMWYHSSGYGDFKADGVSSGAYNTSPINADMSIGTVCHENGHMICGWPDLYKYDNLNGTDGIGAFDIMCAISDKKNPSQPNTYLRQRLGWDTLVNINGKNDTIVAVCNALKSWVYTNPSNPDEMYMIEARKKKGRNANIPDDGLVVWHIDKNGDNQTKHHLVYLVHANNNMNDHSAACFRSDRTSSFTDFTVVNSRWYGGFLSRLTIKALGKATDTIRFVVSQAPAYDGDAVFFESCNYGGNAVALKAGAYTTADLINKGIADNSISSVQLGQGAKVSLYRDNNFTGSSFVFSTTYSCLGVSINDSASSLKVEKQASSFNAIYRITSVLSGKSFDVSGSLTAKGTTVNQREYGGNANQKWSVVATADSRYVFTPQHLPADVTRVFNLTSCKTTDGTRLNIDDYKGANCQKFCIVKTGDFYLIKTSDSSKCVEIANNSMADGGIIRLATCSGNENQKFEFQYVFPTTQILPIIPTEIAKVDAKKPIASVYPNPVSDVLFFSVNTPQNYAVYSVSGQILLKGQAIEANVNGLKEGLYFIQIGKQNYKFIKR